MRAHAAHEAQGTHARAKMTGQGQFLHVLMRMGCGDELPETAAEICALAGGVRPSVELPVIGTHGPTRMRMTCACAHAPNKTHMQQGH